MGGKEFQGVRIIPGLRRTRAPARMWPRHHSVLWWGDPHQRAICAANQSCLRLLQDTDGLDMRILDRASRGRGWPPNRGGVGHAARYFYPLTEDEAITRAMLGYEIYMRFYALNMWRIKSPYSFTALGSALALPVRIYRQLGGMTPRSRHRRGVRGQVPGSLPALPAGAL